MEVATGDDPPRVVSATTNRMFDVETSGESLLARIERDYRAGVISPDEAARHSLLSAIDPDHRAERYAALYDDDIGEDPQALALFAASLEQEVSEETRAELERHLNADEEPPGTGSEAAAAGQVATLVTFDPADYPDCSFFNGSWSCRTHITSEDAEAEGEPIDLVLTYRLGARPGQVRDDDDDGNRRPDQIDDLITAAVEAWRFYHHGLGMRPIDERIRFVVGRTADHGALAVPAVFTNSATVYLEPDAARYLVRHELFHLVEYQYITASDIAGNLHPMLWLLEASAEWAAFEAEQRLGPYSERSGAGRYAAHLPEALGQPHRTLDDTRRLSGGPEYGSFPFLEYLDQAHGGNGAVEIVLRDSGDGARGRRPTRVIAELVPSWADAVVEYRQWTYLLTRDPGHDIGFAEPPDRVRHIDGHWRGALQDDPRTAGASVRESRPARVQRLDRSSTPVFSVVGSAGVYPGGAAYVEIDVPRGTRDVDISIETRGEEIRAVTMPTARYPRLCQPPTSVHIRPPGGAADATLERDCRRLVLLVVNTAQPGIGAGAQDVTWAVRVDTTTSSRPSDTTRQPRSDPAWDILRHHVAFGDTVELAMDLAAPRDPGTWPNGAIVQWRLELRREDEIGYANVLVWSSGVVEVVSDRGHVWCSSVNPGTDHAFDGTSHRVTLAPDCLRMDGLSGPPTELRVAAIAGIPGQFVDSAPNGYRGDGPITRFGGPVPQGQRATFEDDDTS